MSFFFTYNPGNKSKSKNKSIQQPKSEEKITRGRAQKFRRISNKRLDIERDTL